MNIFIVIHLGIRNILFSPMASNILIYNSVVTRRHRHINSSASTPLNAMKIAEMKDSHHGQVIVEPELLFSIYKCCFLGFVCAR